MQKKFQVNQTKIKGGCQSETKAAHCFSCTDLTLGFRIQDFEYSILNPTETDVRHVTISSGSD